MTECRDATPGPPPVQSARPASAARRSAGEGQEPGAETPTALGSCPTDCGSARCAKETESFDMPYNIYIYIYYVIVLVKCIS